MSEYGVSIGTMIKKLGGMLGTADFRKERRNHDFIENMLIKTDNGKETRWLTERQVEWISDLHRRHFG